MSALRRLLSDPLVKTMLRGGLLLGLFAVIGGGLVAGVYEGTKARIAANEREALERNIRALVPPDMHDNDIIEDTIQVRSRELLGSDEPLTVYRARKGGKPVAAIIEAVAPDGYSGNIYLLVAVKTDGTLAGVRVLSHKETPGLGDAIEVMKSDWILGFTGKSLHNPPPERWKVKRDGGVFDQFTGATITPRAVVQAVYRALRFYRERKQTLFEPPPASTAAEQEEPQQ